EKIVFRMNKDMHATKNRTRPALQFSLIRVVGTGIDQKLSDIFQDLALTDSFRDLLFFELKLFNHQNKGTAMMVPELFNIRLQIDVETVTEQKGARGLQSVNT